MADVPEGVPTGRIVFRASGFRADDSDVGDRPNLVELNGRIIITATVSLMQFPEAIPPFTAVLTRDVCPVINGVLYRPGSTVDALPVEGVPVIASAQPGATPDFTQYRASFELTGPGGASVTNPPSVTFNVPADGVVDLSLLIVSAPPQPGTVVVVSHEDRIAAEQAASSAADTLAQMQKGVPGGVAELDAAGLLPETRVPERLTPDALSATIEAALGEAVPDSASSPQLLAFMKRMSVAAEPTYITALGDSTGASPTGWLIELVRDKIAPAFPGHTVQSRDWSHTDQRYAPVPTVHQVGAAGVRRLVTTGAATDRFAKIADSPETSPAGELDVRFKLKIPAAAAFTLGGKYDTTTPNRAWFVMMDSTGKLQLFFSPDGTTQYTRTSTVAVPAEALGVPVWLRVTFDGDNGASGNDTAFWYSLDGVTWTQIGTTVTAAGTQTIFDSTAATQYPSRSNVGNASSVAIEYHAFQMFTSLTAGARPAIDMEFAQWNGYGSNATAGGANVATFTDYVGNTVQIDGTGLTGNMQGAPVLTLLNGCVPGQTISYASDSTRFPKLTPIPSALTVVNFSHNEVSLVNYTAPYAALADAILAKWPNTGIIAVAQNPRNAPASNITEHAIRVSQVITLALSRGWALLDAYALLDANLSLVSSDGIHPTDAGYDVIRDEAWRLFTNA